MITLAATALAVMVAATTTAQADPLAATPPDSLPLRLFFLTDAHSRHEVVRGFVETANRERPDLVLEGGDMVHDGTEPEFRRARAQRARLTSPWYGVRGNHDSELRGPFEGEAPSFPACRAIDLPRLHLILLDNHEERLTEQQFAWLEEALRERATGRVLVVMHVPPTLSREPALVRLRHLAPFPLASPVMSEEAQVERFLALMARHQVLAVLTGHAHFHDHQVIAGVHYLTASAIGGLLPGPRTAGEYLDITIVDREVSVERVVVRPPAANPATSLARAFRFYVDLNRFNHDELGWRYVPSVSVDFRLSAARLEVGEEEEVAMFAGIGFERLLGQAGRHGFPGELGILAGERVLAGRFGAGYRLRPLGDFNGGLYFGLAATANAGVQASAATVGVGARLEAGAEWRHLAVRFGHDRATNHRATGLGFAYRF